MFDLSRFEYISNSIDATFASLESVISDVFVTIIEDKNKNKITKNKNKSE